jgi:hypothetical protein
MRNTTKTTLINCLALAVLAPLALANNPTPFIDSTAPVAAQPGGAAFTLTVYGAGFRVGSVVNWQAGTVKTPLSTTYVSPEKLTAAVPAPLIAAPGTALVTVVSADTAPAVGTSNPVPFPVATSSSSVTYSPITTATGNVTFAMAEADFNSDGIPDLAVANTNENTLSILLGNGDGTFRTASTPAVGSGPIWLAAGDFNGDGIPDLAVANEGAGTVSILLGNGDGTFTAAAAVSVGTRPTFLVAADINGDGFLDLVVANETNVYIALGGGNGTFPNHETLTFASTPLNVAVADFNGDGTLDIAVTQTNNTVCILLQTPEGFFNSSNPAVGNSPTYLAAEDFNGDGKMDLVVVNYSDGTVTTLLGNGDGTFSTASTVSVGAAPIGGAIGDLNGDGIPDFAVTSQQLGTVSLLLGNGDGTFHTETITAGGIYNAMTVADINGDGRLDLAFAGPGAFILLSPEPVASLSPGSLGFAGQGVGTSSTSQPVTLGNTGPAALSIAAIATSGDFSQTNNCGTSLPAGSTCTVNVTFAPTASGSRSGSLTVTDNSNGQANATQTAALTGTGVAVPLVGPLPSQLVFPGQPVNTVSNSQSFPLSNIGTSPLTVLGVGTTGTFGENNNCGASLAVGASCTINVFFIAEGVGVATGTVIIIDNNDGVFGTSQTVNLTGTGTSTPAAASISPAALTFGSQLVETGSAPQAITLSNAANAGQLTITGVAATGDFSETNNCGGSLLGGSSCTVNVTFTPTAEGQRTGTLTVTDNNNGVTGSTQSVSLTGSGRPAGENATPFISDISPVSAAAGGAKFVLTVRGSGFTAPALHWQVGTTVTKLTATAITDESFTVAIPASLIHTAHTATLTAVNPDTAPATGVSNAVLFPVGADTASAIFSLTAVSDTSVPLAVVAADFNNDGKADLAVANTTGTVSIFLGNGKGGFELASTPSAGSEPVAVAAGDFNGDGKPDLAVVDESGTVTILLGNGDGTFSAGAPVLVGTSPNALVVGDFNGDGYPDLAVANRGDNTVSILLGNGDGTFGLLDTLAMESTPLALAAGDFNGDGKLDLAVGSNNNTVVIQLGNGDGTFTTGPTTNAGNPPVSIAIGDFNGDGKLDLALANYFGNTVSILLGNGDGTFTAGATPATGREPEWVAAGDFNGDGKLDLAVANYEDNTVTILLGKGDGTFTTAATPGVSKGPGGLAVADFNGDGKLDVAAATGTNVSLLIQPAFSVSSAALSFTTAFGKTSPPQTVTVTNTGTAALSFTSVTLGGTKPADFARTDTCTGSLLPAASCEIHVTFTPDEKNETVSATVILTDSEGKQEIALTGIGK